MYTDQMLTEAETSTITAITSGTRKEICAPTSGVTLEICPIISHCAVQDGEAVRSPMLLLQPLRLPRDPSRREIALLLSTRHRLRPLRIRAQSHMAIRGRGVPSV